MQIFACLICLKWFWNKIFCHYKLIARKIYSCRWLLRQKRYCVGEFQPNTHLIGSFHFPGLSIVQKRSYCILWHPISAAKGAYRSQNRIDYVNMNTFKSMFTKIVYFTFYAKVCISCHIKEILRHSFLLKSCLCMSRIHSW